MTNDDRDAFIAKHDISMTTRFIPWSQSRGYAEAQRRKKEVSNYTVFRNLNWEVTIYSRGRKLWSGDYTEGQGHCPSYPRNVYKLTREQQALVDAECECGFECFLGSDKHDPEVQHAIATRKAITPYLPDVLMSLALDSRAVDHDSFESWADDYGYSSDSRRAYAAYQACIDVAVALRSGLGDAAVDELIEISSNF